MRDINFNYDLEGDVLSVACNSGVLVLLYWEGGTVSLLDVNGHEFLSHEDAVHGLLVSVGQFPNGVVYSLDQIKFSAICQYDALRAEAEEDAEDERKMEEEISSPYLTGGI